MKNVCHKQHGRDVQKMHQKCRNKRRRTWFCEKTSTISVKRLRTPKWKAKCDVLLEKSSTIFTSRTVDRDAQCTCIDQYNVGSGRPATRGELHRLNVRERRHLGFRAESFPQLKERDPLPQLLPLLLVNASNATSASCESLTLGTLGELAHDNVAHDPGRRQNGHVDTREGEDSDSRDVKRPVKKES